jgi:hypothetical protein
MSYVALTVTLLGKRTAGRASKRARGEMAVTGLGTAHDDGLLAVERSAHSRSTSAALKARRKN